jgi:hypothetical protein
MLFDFISLFKFLECVVHSFRANVGARFQALDIPALRNGSLDSVLIFLQDCTSLQERILEHHERLGKADTEKKEKPWQIARSSLGSPRYHQELRSH